MFPQVTVQGADGQEQTILLPNTSGQPQGIIQTQPQPQTFLPSQIQPSQIQGQVIKPAQPAIQTININGQQVIHFNFIYSPNNFSLNYI